MKPRALVEKAKHGDPHGCGHTAHGDLARKYTRDNTYIAADWLGFTDAALAPQILVVRYICTALKLPCPRMLRVAARHGRWPRPTPPPIRSQGFQQQPKAEGRCADRNVKRELLRKRHETEPSRRHGSRYSGIVGPSRPPGRAGGGHHVGSDLSQPTVIGTLGAAVAFHLLLLCSSDAGYPANTRLHLRLCC